MNEEWKLLFRKKKHISFCSLNSKQTEKVLKKLWFVTLFSLFLFCDKKYDNYVTTIYYFSLKTSTNLLQFRQKKSIFCNTNFARIYRGLACSKICDQCKKDTFNKTFFLQNFNFFFKLNESFRWAVLTGTIILVSYISLKKWKWDRNYMFFPLFIKQSYSKYGTGLIKL